MYNKKQQTDLFQIKIINKIIPTKYYAFRMFIDIVYLDNDFKTYILDNENLPYYYLSEGFFKPLVLNDIRYSYYSSERLAGMNFKNENNKLDNLLRGSANFTFKSVKEKNIFEKSLIKLLTKFLSESQLNYIEIRSLASRGNESDDSQH